MMIRSVRRRAALAASGLALLSLTAFAAPAPPAESLLPADTLGVISIPDWSKASAVLTNLPFGQLWSDPAMRPFRERFEKHWTEKFVAPLERELGVKFADYKGLAQGQITFAATLNGWDGTPGKTPGWLLALDAKDRKDQLAKLLADLRKKWVEAGKQIKTEKVREVELITIQLESAELTGLLDKAFPSEAESEDEEEDAPKEKKPADKTKAEVTLGLSDSLLLAASSPKDIERALARQAGGSAPSLGEQAHFQADQSALFRDSLGYAWIHLKPLLEVASKQLTAAAEAEAEQNPMMPKPDKIFSGLGLSGLQTASFKFAATPEGSHVDFLLRVPESSRQGIFKILALDAKDASPPPFIPADVIKFSRWRLDGQKAWAALESTLASVQPALAGMLQMGLGAVGKDKDPNFDLKSTLIGSLGDDIISLTKAPKGAQADDPETVPPLLLVGSSNPDRFIQGLKAATGLMPLVGGAEATLQEREFLGKKIYSLPLGGPPSLDDSAPEEASFNFAAHRGYVAFSADRALVEEFLRSSEARPLRETPFLNDAAQKVGGMNTGFFAFENQKEFAKYRIETLKNNAGAVQKLLRSSGTSPEEQSEWMDFTLLPPFERIAKYFHFIVYSAQANASGIQWKIHSPTPPELRR